MGARKVSKANFKVLAEVDGGEVTLSVYSSISVSMSVMIWNEKLWRSARSGDCKILPLEFDDELTNIPPKYL